MNIEIIKLKDLKHPERNVRVHTQAQINEMIRSVEKFGQTRPVVIDENGTILIGNGLVEAMRKMGTEEVSVFKKEGLSETDKLKLMMADNKIYSLGIDDLEAVENIIIELGDFDIPGFDSQVLEDIYGDIDIDIEESVSFGAVNEEAVEAAERLHEKRQEAVYAQENNLPIENTQEQKETVKEAPALSQAEKSSADVGRYVICPSCGEKIWL